MIFLATDFYFYFFEVEIRRFVVILLSEILKSEIEASYSGE